MDDVIFAHKLRLLDVAARLRQLGSHALQPCAIVGSEHSGLLFAVGAYWALSERVEYS